MYGRGSLSLDRLLIYSDIYKLGITQTEVDQLRNIYLAYKGQVEDMIYIYKPATTGYDLILSLADRTEPMIDMLEHAPAVDKAGYPCIKMGNIYLKFLPDVNDLAFLEGASTFIPQTGTVGDEDESIVFNNIDEIRQHVINVDLPAYAPSEWHDMGLDIVNLLYRACEQTPPILEIVKKDYTDVPDYVKHIVSVLTVPKTDQRIAFYVSKRRDNNSYRGNGWELPLNYYIADVGNPAYNWTDPDRWCSHIHRETKRPQVFYIDKDPILPKEKEVIDSHRRGAGVLTVDNNTLDILVKRYARRQQDIENEKAAVKVLEKKLKERIDELTAGKEFTYNEVTFRKNEFEYEGQVLSCADVDLKDILAKFSGHYSEDHLNFDRILEVWLLEIYKEATKANKTIRGKIGDVTFAIECKEQTAVNGVKALRYRINGHRINKDEVIQVLGRAICFPDNGVFDEFCETVAACSLKYHKYLAGGILISTQDEIFNQKMEFKISLERVKNKNYITFNDQHFKVGNTNKLLTLLNARGMVRVIDVLLDEAVAGMKSADIQHLLTSGRQALIDQKAREEELLKSTMDMFAIEKVEDFRAQNGKLLNGYMVKGAIRNYVIEEEQLLVYEHPTGRYICMVDRGNNEHTNVARLVNRMYALSNDSKLAKEISTL